jgi:hypothetical protein
LANGQLTPAPRADSSRANPTLDPGSRRVGATQNSVAGSYPGISLKVSTSLSADKLDGKTIGADASALLDGPGCTRSR